jgi:UDP-N-acetylmuramoyl-L-alanyl-D-glutamate--2,6-diaminopimelate ligase
VNTATVADFDAAELLGRLSAPISRISSDSRRLGPGDAFAAYPGAHRDGRAYIPDAIARGAGAILWETQGFHWNRAWKLPHLPIDELKTKLGFIADAVYGHPSRDLWMVGVTGTNGKTSCAHWIAAGLDAAGRRAAVVGTLGNGLIGALESAANTTPDAALLQQMLADYRAAGAQAAVMEVSSHGIDQGRSTVSRSTSPCSPICRAIISTITPRWRPMAPRKRSCSHAGTARRCDQRRRRVRPEPSRQRAQPALGAELRFRRRDIVGSGLTSLPAGLAFTVETPWGKGGSRRRWWVHSMRRICWACSAFSWSAASPSNRRSPSSPALEAPPGRMQRLGGGDRPLVVIDYAHTPDALDKVLTALRPAVGEGNELICLFGAGGERDRGKRPEMGRLAARLADRVLVTSDNPRGEDPAAIASEIVHGIRDTGNRRYSVELDRAIAIASAIGEAGRGDIVLLAGKGHETYQECNGARLPFSDAEHAARALMSWSGK